MSPKKTCQRIPQKEFAILRLMGIILRKRQVGILIVMRRTISANRLEP
jgi:hypothetical protein